MDREFFMENRKALYNMTEEKGLLLLFSGRAPKKTNDENYPFFADRSYMYFTGVHQENTILMIEIYGKEQWEEAPLYPASGSYGREMDRTADQAGRSGSSVRDP